MDGRLSRLQRREVAWGGHDPDHAQWHVADTRLLCLGRVLRLDQRDRGSDPPVEQPGPLEAHGDLSDPVGRGEPPFEHLQAVDVSPQPRVGGSDGAVLGDEEECRARGRGHLGQALHLRGVDGPHAGIRVVVHEHVGGPLAVEESGVRAVSAPRARRCGDDESGDKAHERRQAEPRAQARAQLCAGAQRHRTH